MNTGINPLHYKYWIGILIFVIVLIISSTWIDVQKLADKISFALTISSVILALLAIYFTINFNSLFSNNIVTFLNLNKNIEDTAQKLTRATQELNIKLENVPDSLRGLHNKIDTFTTILNQSSPITTGETQSDVLIKWDDINVHTFFRDLSFSGMISLYLVTKCNWKGKTISLKDVDDQMPMIGKNFLAGFATACSSINLFKFSITADSFIINYCDKHLTQNIDKDLDTIFVVIGSDKKYIQTVTNMKATRAVIDTYVST